MCVYILKIYNSLEFAFSYRNGEKFPDMHEMLFEI